MDGEMERVQNLNYRVFCRSLSIIQESYCLVDDSRADTTSYD